MADLLLEYMRTRPFRDGQEYLARAFGARCHDGTKRWEGWLEFWPAWGGRVLRTPIETVQPNRMCLVYWATGLTPAYIDGALSRATVTPSRQAATVVPFRVETSGHSHAAAERLPLTPEDRRWLKSLGITPT